MTTTARASDGRRLYTPEFKRQQVDRGLKGEITLAALSRERGISRSLIQRWKQLLTRGGETAVAAPGEVVPAGDRAVAAQIRAVIRDRAPYGAPYGYRRVTALANRACGTAYTRKRGRRVGAAPVQWLSDSEGMYAALEPVIAAERLGLMPVTTPAYSPESNGMAEAVVKTMNRDDVDGAPSARRPRCSTNSPHWIADYNGVAPHSALRYLAPHEYRQRREQRTD